MDGDMRSDPAVDRKKLSPLGKEIVGGLEEVLEHVRGKIKLRTRAVEVPSRVDLKALRKPLPRMDADELGMLDKRFWMLCLSVFIRGLLVGSDEEVLATDGRG
jgi:hypothetical protein